MRSIGLLFLTLILFTGCEDSCPDVEFESMYTHVTESQIVEVYYISNSYQPCAEQKTLMFVKNKGVESRVYTAYFIDHKNFDMPVGTRPNEQLLTKSWRRYNKPAYGEGSLMR
jgi:hypothetical protein